MTKTPPYIGNPSNTQCQQAVQAMMLLHFGKVAAADHLLFKKLDKMNRVRAGAWTSDNASVVAFVKEGMDVVYGTGHDLEKIAEDPYRTYVDDCGQDIADAYQDKMDLKVDAEIACELLSFQSLYYQKLQNPNQRDIYNLINAGYLVNLWVNSKALNGLDGFAGHYVLAYRSDGNEITFHDPGGHLTRGSSFNVARTVSCDFMDGAMRYSATGTLAGMTAYRPS